MHRTPCIEFSDVHKSWQVAVAKWQVEHAVSDGFAASTAAKVCLQLCPWFVTLGQKECVRARTRASNT